MYYLYARHPPSIFGSHVPIVDSSSQADQCQRLVSVDDVVFRADGSVAATLIVASRAAGSSLHREDAKAAAKLFNHFLALVREQRLDTVLRARVSVGAPEVVRMEDCGDGFRVSCEGELSAGPRLHGTPLLLGWAVPLLTPLAALALLRH